MGMRPLREGRTPVEGAPHGTVTAYTHYRCKCDPCRAANAAHHSALRQRRRELGSAPTHGTSGYANYGCRCPVCTDAHRLKCLAYYHSHIERFRGYEATRKAARGARSAPVS